MTKALVLLSGGLDSMLAAKVLMEQGIEVTGLSFKSYFFGTAKAKKVADQLGIKLIEIDFSDEHLAMVKNPKHGYGKNLNPCIDCHGLMLKKAAEHLTPALSLARRGGKKPPLNPLPASPAGGLRKEGNNSEGGKKPPLAPPLSGGRYDFVATGEVLGERPMSQNAEALKTVEKESGLTGRLIRPLSAKLLTESDAERDGLVNRRRLLSVSGRSRKPQLALVKKYGIKEYSSPGGGCSLTDPVLSEKLMKMLEYWPDCAGQDIELLKYGRIFWLDLIGGGKVLTAVGREEKDNENLLRLAQIGDIIIELEDEAGPTSLVRSKNLEVRSENGIKEIDVPKELKMGELKLGEGKSQEEIIKTAVLLTGYYAAKARGKKIKVNIKAIK